MPAMATSLYDSREQRRFLRFFRDLVRARELMLDLVRKDLRARYRYAFMGFLWAVLEPVALMAVLTFVFSFVLQANPAAARGAEGVQSAPYAVFLLCGLIFWQFTANVITTSVRCVIDNQNLVKKVYFAREAVPIAALGYPLVNLCIGFALLIALHLALGGGIGAAMLWAPLLFGMQLLLTAGAALLLSCTNVLFRDIGYMAAVAVLFGFYATPVFYPLELVLDSEKLPALMKGLYLLNPMAELLTAYRQALFELRTPDAWLFVWPGISSVVLFFTGAWTFRRLGPTLSDYL
jgi:ABC-type polysaccharide/polyol phosphate export permease